MADLAAGCIVDVPASAPPSSAASLGEELVGEEVVDEEASADYPDPMRNPQAYEAWRERILQFSAASQKYSG